MRHRNASDRNGLTMMPKKPEETNQPAALILRDAWLKTDSTVQIAISDSLLTDGGPTIRVDPPQPSGCEPFPS